MTGEQRERLKEVFAAALPLGAEQRARFLAEACAGDDEVRREAESLLASHDAAGGFIESPVVVSPPVPADDPLLGRTLGPWRLVGEIARGGMGVVYRAVRDDASFHKEAAVKLLPAEVGTPLALARFRAERSILARLEHPGIARLLDGGTAPDGRPYYVMELVEGEWIDRYCERRALGVRERLRLFAAVCDAVHYAHQNLVLHRDLKPGNILVTGDGRPRLLDFGIAKLLDPADASAREATVTELRALTPRYASPEQVTGSPLTTASDVYSLGVLLYELLSGRPPYEMRTRSPEELVRVVCREEPERPSAALRRAVSGPSRDAVGDEPAAAPAASQAEPEDATATGPLVSRHATPIAPRELEGDLDWIVLKALRKEPERRYASARELAEDVQRHLDGRPVLARPDTLGYRVGKLVRQHRVAAAAVSLGLVAVVLGLIVSVWQWRRAEAAHAEAERRFDDVRKLAGSLLFEVHDAVERLPGSTPVRALIVKRGVEYLDRLAASALDRRLRAELAAAYVRLGDVQGRAGESSLGDTAAAMQSYRKAVLLVGPLLEGRTPSVEERDLGAHAHARLSEALDESGQAKEAAVLLERSVSLLESAVAEAPDRLRLRSSLAARRYDQAAARARAEKWDGALDAYRRGLRLYEDLAAAEPGKALHRRNAALMHRYMGGVCRKLDRTEEARRHYQQAVAIDRVLLDAAPEDPSARLDLSYDVAELARLEATEGRVERSLEAFREALALRQSVLDADPQNVQARAATARARRDVAILLTRMGSRAQAEAEMRGAIADWQKIATRASVNVVSDYARDLATLGEMLLAPGAPHSSAREAEACSLYARSTRALETVKDRLSASARSWTPPPALAARCTADNGERATGPPATAR